MHFILTLLFMQVVFGIPGAKVDAVFDTLSDHPEIKLGNMFTYPISNGSPAELAKQLFAVMNRMLHSWQQRWAESLALQACVLQPLDLVLETSPPDW